MIVIVALAIHCLQAEGLFDALLPGMRGYVRVGTSLLHRVNLRRRAQIGTDEHLLMRAHCIQKVVVESNLVQLRDLVDPLVAFVELRALLH